jgi:hypothetical protein
MFTYLPDLLVLLFLLECLVGFLGWSRVTIKYAMRSVTPEMNIAVKYMFVSVAFSTPWS